MRGLARRLLLKKSSSTDCERLTIAKLRVECGAEFSTRSDSMIKDYNDSVSFQNEYKFIRKNEGEIESMVHILS